MVQVKLLVITTNEAVRRQLLQTWRDSTIRQRGSASSEVVGSTEENQPVAFTRLDIRDGLGLCIFLVDGGWRREYVCQALARTASGYCIIVGPEDDEARLATDLLALLHAHEGLVGALAVAGESNADRVRAQLRLPDDFRVPVVDCQDVASITALLCELLERMANAAAA